MSQLFQNISMEDIRVLRKAPRSANTPADRSKPATQLSPRAALPALCPTYRFCKHAKRALELCQSLFDGCVNDDGPRRDFLNNTMARYHLN